MSAYVAQQCPGKNKSMVKNQNDFECSQSVCHMQINTVKCYM